MRVFGAMPGRVLMLDLFIPQAENWFVSSTRGGNDGEITFN
jgi:hypothetical protein